MDFTIISAGRLKEPYFAAAAAEYVKRIGGLASRPKLRLVDIKDDCGKTAAADFAAKIPRGAYVFALCVEGKQLPSEDFSAKLREIYLSEKKGICFLVGGAEGLPAEIRAASDFRLSMSEMTFPHRLAKIMLLEQLYRALTIQNNIKYHK